MATDDYPGGWFGESWGAPVCEEERHKPTPVGKHCPECFIPINDDDQGMLIPCSGYLDDMLAYHRICFLRTVIPCGMWTAEMKQNLPEKWQNHVCGAE